MVEAGVNQHHMKTFLKVFVALLLSTTLLFGAALDIRIPQRNSTNTAWPDVILPGTPNKYVGTDGTGRLTLLDGGVGVGSGTVTSASVVTANGVSATVATPTTTPAFTFTLGAITPSSVVASGAIQAGTTFTVAGAASPTTSTAGQWGFDNNAWAAGRGAFQLFDGTANTYVVGVLVSDAPTNGQVLKWNTGGTVTWEDDTGEGGTVTSASVTTANGVSATVATATTTPAFTFSLGAITPTTVVAAGAITAGTTFTAVGATAPTTSTAGQFAFDTNAHAASRGALQLFDGTANTYLLGMLASDSPANGQVPKWNTGGTITWEDETPGGTTVGTSLMNLANPSAITFIRINADNSVTALSDANYRTALGLATVAASGSASDITVGTLADSRVASSIARLADFDTAAERAALGFKTTTHGGLETVQAHGAMGATETFDLATANTHTGTLDANLTVTLTGFTTGKFCSTVIGLTQDATGSRTVTWPAAVVTAPTITSTANAVTWVSLWSTDGGTTVYATSTAQAGGGAGDVTASGTLTSGNIVLGAGTTVVTTSNFAVSGNNITGIGNLTTGNLTVTNNQTIGNLSITNLTVSGSILGSFTNGQLLIGNTAGGRLDTAALTAGDGITITNAAGAITINSTLGGGNMTNNATLTTGRVLVGGGTSVAGVLGAATNGQVLIGNSTSGNLQLATITAGDGITVTNAAGAITINATGSGSGNVTSSGTPTSGQIAEFTTATNIQGVNSVGTGGVVREVSGSLDSPSINTPTVVGIESHQGATVSDTYAITGNVIDVTKRKGLLSLTGNVTVTFSGTPANLRQTFSAEFFADSTERVVTLPANVFRLGYTTALPSITVLASTRALITFEYVGGGGYNAFVDIAPPEDAPGLYLTPANNLSDVSNAATARTNLALVPGTNVQAFDADLSTYAGITPAANTQSLLGAANYAAMRGLLDLEAGTDFLAYPTGTPTGSKFLRDDNSWQTPAGGGTVTSSGPPTAGQIATFSTATNLEGVGTTGGGLVVLATSPVLGTPNIAKISNLTGNGLVKTSGGDGTLGTATAGTDYAATRTGVVREIWVGAGAMTPSAVNGAATATYSPAGADGASIDVFDFDDTTSESVQFTIAMPSTWNFGTVKFKVYWTTTSGTGTVIWSVAGGAASDDDALGAILGTAVTVTDTRLADADLHISPATAAVTVGGTPALDDLTLFKVLRDISDTKTGDARLIGVKLQYTESATEPTAW